MSKLKQLRTRCFFDVSIAEDIIGRVIFELYNDVCPKTCENFKALCTGEKGNGRVTGKPLHYKNVLFHRVVKTFIIQSGDFSHGNGRGGESIYGGTFEDESFDFKHTKPFMLSMANRGKNTNGSQFFITLAPAPHLDGVHVAFGHVISGEDVVMKIANQAVDKDSKPFVDIRIANCGELIPQIKSKDKKKSKKVSGSEASSSDSSSGDSSSSDSGSDSGSSSDDEESRTKKKNEENENLKENESTTKNGQLAVPINDLPNAPKVYNIIKADEIPEVPQNRFLARFKPKEEEIKTEITKENEDGKDNRDKDRDREKERNRSRNTKVSYTKSGRKVKGRGFLRYRTPSPDRGRDRDRDSGRFRRSETPPHWKQAQSRVKSFKEITSKQTEQKKNGNNEESRNRSSLDDRSRGRHQRSKSRSRSGSRDNNRRDSRRRSRSPSNDRHKWRKRSRNSLSRTPERNSDRRAKERKGDSIPAPDKREREKLESNQRNRPLEVRESIEE